MLDRTVLKEYPLNGYVYSNLILKKHEVDAVIITSCVYEKEIRKKIKKLNYLEEKIVSFFEMD